MKKSGYLVKLTLASLLTVAGLSFVVQVHGDDLADAKQRAQSMIDEGRRITLMPDGQEKVDAISYMLRKYVSVQYIANFSVGQYMRLIQAQPSLIAPFYNAFEFDLALFLENRLGKDFAEQEFRTTQVTWLDQSEGIANVKLQGNTTSVSGSLQMVKSKADGQFWINDLKVDNIDLLIVYRSRIADRMSSIGGNVQALIDYLNRK